MQKKNFILLLLNNIHHFYWCTARLAEPPNMVVHQIWWAGRGGNCNGVVRLSPNFRMRARNVPGAKPSRVDAPQ